MRRGARRETGVDAGEFDYDETVDLLLNMEGAEAPVAMERVSLAQGIQVVVDQWPPSSKGSVLITRDGPDLTSSTRFLRSTIATIFRVPQRSTETQARLRKPPGLSRTSERPIMAGPARDGRLECKVRSVLRRGALASLRHRRMMSAGTPTPRPRPVSTQPRWRGFSA